MNGKDAKFGAFPHAIVKEVKTTDKLTVILKKLGRPEPGGRPGLYYYKLAGGATALVKGFEDDDDTTIPKNEVQYISAGV